MSKHTALSEISAPTILIKMPEVSRRVCLCKSQIYKLIAQGVFPKPIKIGARSIAFLSCEIDSWVAQRIVESRGNEVA